MPVERLAGQYARLFELRVLHHYWLDDGATIFDALSAQKQWEHLQRYDVRSLLEIAPTESTAAKLGGLRAVCKTSSLGLVVGVPADTMVPETYELEFTLRTVDADFQSYTAYGLTVPTLVIVYEEATHKALRYRAGAALYSNLTGCARGSGAAKQLFLTQEAPALQETDRIESIANDGGALVQLLSDPPAQAKVVLGADAQELPAFATHADVPAIAPPPGIVGTVPARGILLPSDASADVFAMVRIAVVNATDPDFSCIADGVAKQIAPVFQLRFKNRRTLWRRFRKSAPETLLSEEGPLPLTYAGNPSGGQKPATRAVKLDRTGTAITNIVSEIYT